MSTKPTDILHAVRELAQEIFSMSEEYRGSVLGEKLDSFAERLSKLADRAEAESQRERDLEEFVVKHYSSDESPCIKGNGFDGLRVGDDREEAEEFIAWVNARIAMRHQREGRELPASPSELDFAGQKLQTLEELRAELDPSHPQREGQQGQCRDLSKCPGCGGPADNGHDRCVPPNPYYCSKCDAPPEPRT